MSSKKHYLIPLITSTYVLLLLIGSTYPFTDWQWPAPGNWLNSFEHSMRYVPRSDFIINFLIYIPLGLLISILLRKQINYFPLLITSTAIATGFGLIMEALQLFIPPRAHSFIDLSMNASGAFAGALIHHFTKKHSKSGNYLRDIRYKWFRQGRYAELGLVIIGLWALSEISPLAPTIKFELIAVEYSNFTQHLFAYSGLNFFTITAFAFEIVALFLITEFILNNKTTSLFVFGVFAGVVIYLKLPVADTRLAPEYVWGLIAGIGFYFVTQKQSINSRTKLVMYALFLAYLISQLNHPPQILSENFNAFNWLPFDSDAKRINRVTELLNIAWIFLALSFFTLSIKQANVKKNGLIGLSLIGIVTLLLEWQQLTLQNTSADITDVMVAMFAWALPYFHPEIRRGGRE